MIQQLVGSSSLGLGKLIDGKNQFVHIRYSAKADGSNMTSEIQPDTKYIGIRTSSSETPSINPADYSWGRFVGASGSSSYTWIRYSANEDGSNMTTIANEDTKYIGVAITGEDSAPTDHTRYSWALFKGSDGRGVERTEVSYQKSTSGTVIPTGSWSTSIPSVSDGEYLWTRTLFFYTDGTTTSTFSVSRNGVTGLGIANTDVHYQKSTSGTTTPTGTWTVTIPNVMPNEYLWTRTTITYTDGSTTVSYSVGKIGADGRDAQLLYLTASSQVLAFDENDKPKTTEAIIISAKLQNASGAATFVAIPYIGNTAQPTITLGGSGNDRTLLPSQWANTKWTSIAVTATLGSLTDTISINKVKDGDTGPKGNDGIPGKDGVGILNTSIQYAQSTSGTTAPSTGWATQVPTLIKGQYLWTKTTWTYTDASTETGYTVSYNAKDGNNGNDGIPGKDGVGIASTLIQYAGSTSGTTKPTTGWSSSIPVVANGSYLWTKTTWNYTDGTSETGYSVAKMGETGPKGDKGNDGLPGKDGVGLKSTVITYGLSDSETTQPTSWGAQVPTLTKGKFLWTKTVWTYTDNTTETGYQKTYIARDGNNGTDGIPGKDGVGIKSTTITYAASTSGTTKPTSGWSATIPSVSSGQYLWTRTVWTYTDNTSETGYSVAKMGEKGQDGQNSYMHTAYSNITKLCYERQNFTITTSSIVRYGYADKWVYKTFEAGTYAATNETFGRDPYIGKGKLCELIADFSLTDSTGRDFLGTYSDNNANAVSDPSCYTWQLTKGDQGIQGLKGADGQSLYTWLKYADDANGNGMSETPDGKKYIGLAYNKTVATESNNPGDYTWSLIQGANGVNGADGKTYYTWVKYADNASGGGMSDSPSGKSYIGLAYNKTTPTESTNPSDYQWALIKGDKGDNGADGENAINAYLTNENITLKADTQGNLKSGQLDLASGQMVVVDGPNVVTSGVSYSIVSQTGCTATIDSAGNYRLTALTADSASVILRASYKGAALQKTFSVNKLYDAVPGQNGQNGVSPIVGYLTNENFIIQTNQDGSLDSQSLAKANGYFNVYQGDTKLTNGVTFSIISQTGVNVTLNATTGYYAVNSMSADFGTAIFKAVYNKVEIKKQLMVVKNKSAIGVVVADNPPSNPMVGQLWKNTGYGNGYSYGTTYYYTGSSWQVYLFYAANIQAKNLAALSANLGNVTAGTITSSSFTTTFDRAYTSTKNRVGSLVLDDGKMRIDYYDRNTLTGQETATNSYMEYSETGIDFAENDGTASGKRLELNSNRIALGDSDGSFYADPSKMTLSGDGYFKLQPKYFLGSNGDLNYQKMSWTTDGFELQPVDALGYPRTGNTGIEIGGDNSYVDFKTPSNSTVDYQSRVILRSNQEFEMLHTIPYRVLRVNNEAVGGETHIVSKYSNVGLMCGNGVNVRNQNNTAWKGISASSFTNASDEKWKYNVKDMPSRLEQFKNLDFKAYRLWAESGKYQEGVIANDNIELPFINKDYDGYSVDTYSYITFIGKATQEYITQTDNTIKELKNENVELKTKITNLESELNNITTELEIIKQQLPTSLNK